MSRMRIRKEGSRRKQEGKPSESQGRQTDKRVKRATATDTNIHQRSAVAAAAAAAAGTADCESDATDPRSGNRAGGRLSRGERERAMESE